MHSRALTFDFVPLHEVFRELYDRTRADYAEVMQDALSLDWDYYIQASLAGACWVATARHEGRLVGYSVYQVTRSNRKSIMEAFSEGLFIDKKYRGQGRRLLEMADAKLKAMGVAQVAFLSESEQFGRFLGRSGFKDTHKLWSKNL